MIIFNRRTSQIDFRLFDAILEASTEEECQRVLFREEIESLRRYEGYYVCVPEAVAKRVIPENYDGTFVSELSALKHSATTRRGPKPTGAKAEFFRRYPNGKPTELSGDAIAAELTEAGYPISGRQILNYSKEVIGK